MQSFCYNNFLHVNLAELVHVPMEFIIYTLKRKLKSFSLKLQNFGEKTYSINDGGEIITEYANSDTNKLKFSRHHLHVSLY